MARYDDDLDQDLDEESLSESPGGRPRRQFKAKKKVVGCGPRCAGRQSTKISYKEVAFLERYVTAHGKIRPRRQTSNCANHQRAVALAIKRARYMALLPFAGSHDFTTGR